MDKKELFKFASDNNLNWIIHFHNYLKITIQNAIIEINEKLIKNEQNNDEKKNLLIAKHAYEETFLNMLKNTVFLQMVSHFEETCYHIWKSFAPSIKLNGNHGLTRYTPVFNHLIDGGVGNLAQWNLIRDGEQLRHCLLHVYGRVSLYKKKNEVERIINKYHGEISVEHDRIQIESTFLDRFAKSLSEITEVVISSRQIIN